MIAYLKGKIINKIQNYIILCPENIGYKVEISEKLFSEISINQEIELYIYHHIRENSSQLFGFNDVDELEMFELLLSVSGIGPKSALGAISSGNIYELKDYISKGDPSLFVSVSGIGKKTAERIVLELRDKIAHLEMSNQGIGDKTRPTSNHDEIDALIALGYSLQQARSALQKVPPEITDSREKIKIALKEM